MDGTVDDRQIGHVNQVGHLTKTHLNLIENHEIGSLDTSESKQKHYVKYNTCDLYIKSYLVVPLQLTVPLTCRGLYILSMNRIYYIILMAGN